MHRIRLLLIFTMASITVAVLVRARARGRSDPQSAGESSRSSATRPHLPQTARRSGLPSLDSSAHPVVDKDLPRLTPLQHGEALPQPICAKRQQFFGSFRTEFFFGIDSVFRTTAFNV
jgi:hypothetical protein